VTNLKLQIPPKWTELALCDNQDTNIWFPETDDPEYAEKVTVAVNLCNSCSVRKECLIYAIRMNEDFGIWGGKTPRQRRKISRDLNG